MPVVESDHDFNALPEGAEFTDPDGNKFKKPAYEPVNFTTQTMHSMAVSDREKRKILEKGYPGSEIVDTPDGPVVNDNGVMRKPGKIGSVGSAAGMVSGNLAPVAGSILGGIGGAGLGTAGAPGVGTLGGGVAGAVAGGAAGQYFNDIIMKLNGTYDRTPGEELSDKLGGIAANAAGEAGGQAIAGFVPSIKAGVSNVSGALPKIANSFLGAGKENLAKARGIAELGEKPAEGPFAGIRRMVGNTDTETPVGVSTWAKDAPHLSDVQEIFNPAFDLRQPLKRGAETAYERMTPDLLEKQGVGAVDDLVSPTAPVATRKAGKLLSDKAIEQSSVVDAKWDQELAARKAALETGAATDASQSAAIHQLAAERQANASHLVQAGLDQVDRTADQAVRAAAQGTNTGDLWQAVGTQVQAVRTALGQRYRDTAQAAYHLVHPGATIDAAPLAATATDFLESFPPEFRGRFSPTLVRDIERLGQRTGEEGEELPATVSLEELHNIRSGLRSAADWYDLPSDTKNGALKYFSHQVDNLIQQAGEHPAFSDAVRLLNENDRWFAAERPVFNSREMRTVLRGLESGEPADPEQLFKALVRPGSTDLIARTEQVVGPNLWNGVRAAQRQQWLRNARAGQFDNTVDAGKFASEVLDAHNNGTLFAVQGRQQGEALLQQAQQIAMLDGRLDVNFRPNDTAFDVFREARLAAERAAKEADTNPLAVLTQQTRQVVRDVARERNEGRRTDPLRFLTDKSFGYDRAVNKILESPDLIMAAAQRFDEDSAEFNALRAVWTEKMFKGTLKPGARMSNEAKEVQQLMLGTNLPTAQKIAEDMAFITSASGLKRPDAAGGMTTMQMKNHPIAGRAGVLSKASKIVPGLNAGGRSAIAAYLSLMSKLMQSPATLRWLEKGYATSPEFSNTARPYLQQIMARGGAAGAGASQALYQNAGQ